MKRNIALLTDFGNRDGFVGAVKGVILSINPDVNIVDISHEITPFDILEASLVLKATYNYFPKGTIFVSVVDPGVGTDRKKIIVETEDYIFVAPDNGLLTLPLQRQQIKRVISIENQEYFLESSTNTFHGRDIFAPVAGHISLGKSLEVFGKGITDYKKLDDINPVVEPDRTVAKVIKFDRFGNAITNIESLPKRFKLLFKGYEITDVCSNFMEGKRDKPNLILGSFGYYELFIPEASLRDVLDVKLGELVEVYCTATNQSSPSSPII